LKNEKIVISDICIQSQLSESTTRRTLKKLENANVIFRSKDSSDKRRCFIDLSLPYQHLLENFVDQCATDFEDLILLNDKKERLKAEKEKLKAQSYLQQVVNSVPALISYVDNKQHYVFNNDKYYEWFGLGLQSISGQHIQDVFGLDIYKQVLPYINKVLKGEYQQFEIQVVDKNLFNRFLQLSYTPDICKKGKVKGFICHVLDITQLKQAEKKLEEKRKQLEMVIKATDIATWRWVIPTGQAIFNERWAEIIGYTLKELEPIDINTWLVLAHPDDLKLSEILLEQHWNGKTERYICEARMKHKQGHWVWVLDTGQVVEWDSSGKPKLMIGTHQDITARKNHESDLQNTLQLLEAMLESTDSGILVTSEYGHVIRSNQRFAEMWNIPKEMIISQDEKAMLDHVMNQLEDPKAFIDGVKHLYSNDENKTFDTLKFKDGRVFERISHPMHIDTNASGRFWSFRDISD